MVYILLADGFEEIEALEPADILIRGGVEVKTVGVTGKTVTGAHGIPVVCDLEISEIKKAGLEAVILPGGMPGTVNLEKNGDVKELIEYAAKKQIFICAICAAPSILGHMEILTDKKCAVCFPGYEKELNGAEILDAKVVKDAKIITAKGAGAAKEFGFMILSSLKNDKLCEELENKMCY